MVFRGDWGPGAEDGSARGASAAVRAAVVTAVLEDGRRVRVRALDDAGELAARVAVLGGYLPSEGDRVLIASDHDERYVVGATHVARAGQVGLSDGSSVEIEPDAVSVRDPSGGLVLRYADGRTELQASQGDLALRAPAGRIVLEAGMDLELAAGRDLVQRGARRVELQAGASDPQLALEPQRLVARSRDLEVSAERSRVVTGAATVLARSIATTATALACHVERYELTAERIVEKSRDTFREVTELLQTRVGRVRTLVREIYTLRSRRTVLRSKQDTSIDGKRILLG